MLARPAGYEPTIFGFGGQHLRPSGAASSTSCSTLPAVCSEMALLRRKTDGSIQMLDNRRQARITRLGQKPPAGSCLTLECVNAGSRRSRSDHDRIHSRAGLPIRRHLDCRSMNGTPGAAADESLLFLFLVGTGVVARCASQEFELLGHPVTCPAYGNMQPQRSALGRTQIVVESFGNEACSLLAGQFHVRRPGSPPNQRCSKQLRNRSRAR